MKNIKQDKGLSKKIAEISQLFIDIPENQKILIKNLIEQSAWMSITLQNMQEELSRDGLTEEFHNGKQVFQRENSLSKTYISLQKNYLATIKELMSYLPPEKQTDELTEFLAKR